MLLGKIKPRKVSVGTRLYMSGGLFVLVRHGLWEEDTEAGP